jgi:hypothetical protein
MCVVYFNSKAFHLYKEVINKEYLIFKILILNKCHYNTCFRRLTHKSGIFQPQATVKLSIVERFLTQLNVVFL